MLRANVDGKLK